LTEWLTEQRKVGARAMTWGVYSAAELAKALVILKALEMAAEKEESMVGGLEKETARDSVMEWAVKSAGEKVVKKEPLTVAASATRSGLDLAEAREFQRAQESVVEWAMVKGVALEEETERKSATRLEEE